MDFRDITSSLPRIHSPRDFFTGYIVPILAVYLFWGYSNKFLGMSVDYLSAMARDITIADTQMNPSYYAMESLALIVGGAILLCFLLVKNEIGTLIRGLRRGDIGTISECSSSIFAIVCFVVSYVLVTSVLELSPGAQIPFFFFGGAVVAGMLLLQDNISEMLSIRPSNIGYAVREPSILVSAGSIVLFLVMTLNLSMIQPVSQNIPLFLSAIILLMVFYWGWRISQEEMKPSVQARRTAALAYLALLPFIMFLLLRVLYLQHDPDPVMQNRWEIQFDFMDKVNTFKINPWPMEVVANFCLLYTSPSPRDRTRSRMPSSA